MINIVQDIRDAETLEEATKLFECYTRPKKNTRPPDYEDVMQFASDYARKYNADIIYVKQKADQAFEFYQTNMEILGARTWKDSNGNTVKNWKLKLANNWFRER
jgi:asparagine synthetase A